MISVAEAAQSLGITVSLLHRLIRTGDLRAYKRDGQRRRLRRRDVNAYRTRRDRWLRAHGRK